MGAASPTPLSSREEELEARLKAAEARVIRAAVVLVRKANKIKAVRQAVSEAAASIQNGYHPEMSEIVPFWNELSGTAKLKIGEMLESEQDADKTDTRRVKAPIL